MASPLCGTGIYANDVLCEVINNLDNLILTAEAALIDAQTALGDLKTSTETEVADIADIDYSANTVSVPKSFVAPTVVPEQVPDLVTNTIPLPDPVPELLPDNLPDPATDALISDATIQSIFDKAADNLAQISVKDERDAQYKYSSMGVGMLNASLQKRIDEAEQNTNERISLPALENAIQEGEWKREDAKVIYGMENERYVSRVGHYNAQIDQYSAQVGEFSAQVGEYSARVGRYSAQTEHYAAELRREAERRGWSEMQIRDILEQADKATLYAVEKTKQILDITRQTDEAIAQLNVGLTQAIYAAADYNLGGSGSQSINTNIAE